MDTQLSIRSGTPSASVSAGPSGITAALNADNELVPTSFVAVAKQTYVSPGVSPDTVMGEVRLEP